MDSLIKNLVEPARSEEDLPVSAVTEVPLSEIMQTCVQTFIPLAESKNKVWKPRYTLPVFMHLRRKCYFMRAAAQQRQPCKNGLSRQAETHIARCASQSVKISYSCNFK